MDREATAAVDALIGEGLLDPGSRERGIHVVQLALEPTDSAASPSAAAAPARRTPQLVEVVAYLGGALVLGAGVLFVAEQWPGLGFGVRVTLLAVATVVLVIAGVVAARVPPDAPVLLDPTNDTRRRLAGALFTGAGVVAGFLAGYVAEELMEIRYPGVYWPAVLGAVAGTVVAAVGYRLAPTAVGLVGMLVGACTAAGQLPGGVQTIGSDGDAAGVVFFVVGLGWLALTETGVFRESTIARTLGVAVTLLGAQIPAIDGTHGWFGYLLTLVVAVGGVAAYLRTNAWPYLAVAVVAVTLVVPEAVADWTEGSLGAVGGVLVAGVTLLVASLGGYRLRSETTDPETSDSETTD